MLHFLLLNVIKWSKSIKPHYWYFSTILYITVYRIQCKFVCANCILWTIDLQLFKRNYTVVVFLSAFIRLIGCESRGRSTYALVVWMDMYLYLEEGGVWVVRDAFPSCKSRALKSRTWAGQRDQCGSTEQEVIMVLYRLSRVLRVPSSGSAIFWGFSRYNPILVFMSSDYREW